MKIKPNSANVAVAAVVGVVAIGGIVKGISTNDFPEALQSLLGADAKGLTGIRGHTTEICLRR